MSTRFITIVVAGCIVAMLAVVTLVVLATGVEHRAPIMDTSYIGIVKSKAPDTKSISDEQLISMGHTACQGLDTGDERYQIIGAMTLGYNISATDAAVVIDTAISNYCPQFKGR